MKLAKTSCIRTARQGRVKVSLLDQVWVTEAPEHAEDAKPEMRVEKTVVAIQRGRKVLGEWVNDTLYLSPQEFRSLQAAIEDFQEDREGDKPSSVIPVKQKSGKRQLTDAEKRLAELADGGGNKPSSDSSVNDLRRGDAQ